MTDGITDRLQALEDRAEITQLVARYGPAVDDHAFDDLAELYTHDAVFDSVGGRIEGREAVIDYYRERGDVYGASYHYPHSVEIHLDGPDRAHGVVCAHAELSIGGETHWVAVRYHDTYHRDGGAWRFHERDVKLLYVLNGADLATGLGDRARVRWPGTNPAIATLGSDLA
ncbi:MAG: nuclear transport factor 2 family protein [bacterium]|nr:nuclear transport factor 2 family protein [bacterium]